MIDSLNKVLQRYILSDIIVSSTPIITQYRCNQGKEQNKVTEKPISLIIIVYHLMIVLINYGLEDIQIYQNLHYTVIDICGKFITIKSEINMNFMLNGI